MAKGKFIVIYGVNGTGKSTQVDTLAANLASFGLKVETLKYPIYGLNPSGPMIQEYLRGDSHGIRNPEAFSSQEFQMLQVINRMHFQPRLEQMLNQGINVVSEDYTGTGVAWGLANGVPLELLERLNSGILKEDLAIYLAGTPFTTAVEKDHVHESNRELIQKAIRAHSRLANKYEWTRVDSSRSIDDVADEIFGIARAQFRPRPLGFYLGMPIASNDGSIQEDGHLISAELQKHGNILDEHVLDPNAYETERQNETLGVNIYQRDMAWLMSSDMAVFNITVPSIGIGREIERSVDNGTPTLVLCNSRINGKPTRMVTHDDRLVFRTYNHRIQLANYIQKFIADHPIFIPD